MYTHNLYFHVQKLTTANRLLHSSTTSNSFRNQCKIIKNGEAASRSLYEDFKFAGSSKSRNCSVGKWRDLSMYDKLWSNLFKERWGIDRATFYEPIDSKSWKDVYIVQDRCDRIGLGLKIIREGNNFFLVHQGEIQRYLGSRRKGSRELEWFDLEDGYGGREEEPCSSILDRILFFIGDLEAASVDLKRRRLI